MGSLIKRSWKDRAGNTRESQYWTYKFYDGPKQLYYSTKLTNKRKANDAGKAYEAEVKKGSVPWDYRKTKYKDLRAGIIADYKREKNKSIDRLNQSLVHLDAFFGIYKAAQITSDRISEYMFQRQDDGASEATINRELSALRRMFNLAKEVTPPKVAQIPTFKLFKENNVRTGFFEHAQFVAIRDALPEYLKGFVTFAYKSGVRDSELKDLTWDQVDLDQRLVVLEVGSTKSGEGRYIPLDDELMEILENLKAKRRKKRQVSPHVFTNADGTNKIGDHRSAWSTACRKAGLGYGYKIDKKYVKKWADKLPAGPILHDMRRTAVRNMIRASVPEKVAMQISGHKTRSVFDRYNIVDDRDIKEAMQKVNGYLKAQSTSDSRNVVELNAENK